MASYDEDTSTLAVAAGRHAVAEQRDRVEALWFATDEPTYLEKSNAGVIHAALRLDESVPALDFGGAARSVIGAPIAQAPGAPRTLATAADIRTGLPRPPAQVAGGVHGGDGHVVVDAKEGGDLRAGLQQAGRRLHDLGGVNDVALGQVAIGDAVVLQGPLVAGLALLDAGIGLGMAADEGDVPVPALDEVGHGLVGPLKIVRQHAVVAVDGGVRVHQDQGRGAALHHAHEGLVKEGAQEEQPVGRTVVHQQAGQLHGAAVLVDGHGGIQQVHLVAAAGHLDAGDDVGVEFVGRGQAVGVGLEDQAHGRDGGRVGRGRPPGHVAQLPGHIQHPLPRLGADAGLVAQDQRHGGQRHAALLGNLGHGGPLVRCQNPLPVTRILVEL